MYRRDAGERAGERAASLHHNDDDDDHDDKLDGSIREFALWGRPQCERATVALA